MLTPCWSRAADQEETSEMLLSLLVIFITPNSCLEIIVMFIISKPLPRRSECFLRKPSLFLSPLLRGHEAIIAPKDLHELQPQRGILRDFYRNMCLLDGWISGWLDSWMDGWVDARSRGSTNRRESSLCSLPT